MQGCCASALPGFSPVSGGHFFMTWAMAENDGVTYRQRRRVVTCALYFRPARGIFVRVLFWKRLIFELLIKV